MLYIPLITVHGLIGISWGCKSVAEPCKAHRHLVFTLMFYYVIRTHWLNYGLIIALSLHYPTVTVALLTYVPLEDYMSFSRWAHRSWMTLWLFNVQAHFPGGTDYFPELCPQSLLTWRWYRFWLGLVESQRHMSREQRFLPGAVWDCLTCKPTQL